MQELTLLPCPNCGHVPDRYDWDYADGRNIQRYCSICDMTGPSARLLEDADAAWNALPRRADIERVERERDWLAENMPNDICPAGRAECAYRCPTAGGKACYECLLCWLEAARQATTER